MHPDVEAIERAIGLLADRITDQREAIDRLTERRAPDVITNALAAAIRQVRDEKATRELFLDLSKQFHHDPATTEATFSSLTKHAKRWFFEWLGERMTLSLTTIVLAGVLAWALTTGKFTK